MEAREFRDAHDQMLSLGAGVIGISKDSVKSHQNFTAKHDLPYFLLADTETTVQQQYGVWVEKKNFGKTYMGTQRSTVIIDKAGKVHHLFPKVKIKGHAAEVKEIVAKM
jgi:peroxiredoxin Q/BCP